MSFPRTILVPLACIAALGACAEEGVSTKSATPALTLASVEQGKSVFETQCSGCHGITGDGEGVASLSPGINPPDLSGLTARNDGAFPRAFVQRFVLGQIEKEDPDAAMPEFGTVGLQHAANGGTTAGEIPAQDMIALLDYIESFQK